MASVEDGRIDDQLTSKIKSTFSSFTSDSFDIGSDKKDESKLGVVMSKEKGKNTAEAIPSMPKINENDFLATFQ